MPTFKLKLDTIYYIALTIFVVGMYNQIIWNEYFWWPLFIMAFMAIAIFRLFIRKSVVIDKDNLKYSFWFIALCGIIYVISSFCQYPEASFSSFRNFWRVGLYITLIILNCKNSIDCKWLIVANWVAGIVVTINLILNFDPTAIALVDTDYAISTRMGLGGIEHPNTTAYNVFISYAFGFYLFSISEGIRRKLIVFSEIFLVVGCLLTGSRKVLITIILIPLIYIIGKSKNPLKLALKVGIVVAVVYTLYLFTQNNEVLYNIIGNRIEDIGGIFGGDDASATGRMNLLTDGLKISLKHPFGVGLNCYKFFSSEGTYAHNEYIEILADMGFVGFILYYLPIIFSYVNLLKSTFNPRNEIPLEKKMFWLSLFTSVLILSFFQVTFAFFSYHTVLALYLTNRNREELRF